ncbi:MAG: hypothetical protein EPO25_05225 [Gammaproteobacteria bacterium]|nr:MAG: hypothetical protein EPO25_05225 [Gammaproteobacteria bacterium]
MTRQIGPYTQTEKAGRQYDARWQRVMDCVALRQPDRMPFGLFSMFWYARYGGMTCRQQMFDTPRFKQVIEQVCLDLQPDMYTPALMGAGFGLPMEVMGYRQLQWPGHGVDDNRPFQYIDREYMTAEEYDDFLFDPTGFYLSKYLPRVADAFAGLEPIASLTGSFYVGTCFGAAAFADPGIATAVQRLSKASGVMLDFLGHIRDLDQRMRSLGFPSAFDSIAIAPYDIIADYFRGATGMMKDLYRHPDKLLQVLDKVATLVIRSTLAAARQTDNPIVFIPVHWAPDAFMSQKQFEKFWWPSFHRLLTALIDAQLVPMPMWEHDCTRRLPFLREHTPRGKCIYWFERTDMVAACAALGDIVALRGGMPASLMISGTPADVDAEVRRLVENVYDRGGRLILEGAFGLPDETPVENVRAMCAAARRYAG